MSRDVQFATPDTTLEQAWKLLASHHLKTLPVLQQGKLVGIVSLSDLVGPAMQRGRFSWRGLFGRKAVRMEQVMSRRVISVSSQHPLERLLPLLCEQGLHCLPVLDADQLVGDAEADYPGPLAGVIAGLKVARHEWVVLLACDAPLVDRGLIEDLLRLAVTSDSAAMVRQGGYWQPMFSVLPRRVLPVLEQAWAAGERSLQKALLREAVQGLECADDDRRLSNFNSPELLQG